MNSWLPGWLGVALATVFGGILVVYLDHVIVVTDVSAFGTVCTCSWPLA